MEGVKRKAAKSGLFKNCPFFYSNACAALRLFSSGFPPIKKRSKNGVLWSSLESRIGRTLKAVLTEKEN